MNILTPNGRFKFLLMSAKGLMLLLILAACQPNKSKNQKLLNQDDTNYDSIRVALESMYDTDQGYRQKINENIQNGEGFDKELVAKMNAADSSNQIHTMELLDKYGWIPKSKIGDKAADALFYIIQHADVKIMEKYFDEFKSLAGADEANKASAAMMEDRILMYHGKKQIYGTQAKSRTNSAGKSEYFIWPIENPAQVNNRRKEAGFKQTVEENAKRLNAIYNPQEEISKTN